MSFWQRTTKTDEPELSRADIILVKKEPRGTAAARTLIQVVIPRQEARQNHQRNEDRCVVADLTARLVVGETVVDMPVVNLSSNGLMVSGAPALGIGAIVQVAIGGCDPVPMAVCWLRGDRTGLEFRAETAIVSESGLQDLIMDAIIRAQGHGRFTTAPLVGPERREVGNRQALLWLCAVSAGEQTVVGRLRNISRTGALIALGEPLDLSAGGELVLDMPNAGEFRGIVRWSSGQDVGVELKDEFPLSLLANEPCVEVIQDEHLPEPGYASREDAMRIRYTGISDPTSAPKMDYQPLTLRELYNTLYDGFEPTRSA